jgi:hypothetical protein
MNPVENVAIVCPYCSQSQDTLVDCSISEQQYVEDCQVCCSPIVLNITLDPDDTVRVLAERES